MGQSIGRLSVAFLLVAGVTWLFWQWIGHPYPLPIPKAEKLDCVSYTPYRDSETPLIEGSVVPAERIETDLTLLATQSHCVRTYSVRNGLDKVVDVAQAHGLKVMLGAWINGIQKENNIEIARATELANAHPDVVIGIIVGNETLLRGELSAEQLAEQLRAVRQRTSVPITYADVWEFWLRYRQLVSEVDFVTIHILPFWEDNPVAASQAMEFVQEVIAKVMTQFPGKKIWIGETGWPSAGRMRGPAEPSLIQQARYIREFITLMEKAPFPQQIAYNIVEAFDQPWKRALEGTVGGYWGIYGTDRQEKFSFTAPVSEHPNWRAQWLESLLCALVLVSLPVVLRLPVQWRPAVLIACVAQVGGTLLLLQIEQLMTTLRTPLAWVIGSSWGIGSLLLLASLIVVLPQPRATWPMPTSLDTLIKAPGSASWASLWLGALRIGFLFSIAATNLQLMFDPRYRDFPTLSFLIPALVFTAFACQSIERMQEERWLSYVLLGCALVLFFNEGVFNHQALAWIATSLLFLWHIRTVAHRGDRLESSILR